MEKEALQEPAKPKRILISDQWACCNCRYLREKDMTCLIHKGKTSLFEYCAAYSQSSQI